MDNKTSATQLVLGAIAAPRSIDGKELFAKLVMHQSVNGQTYYGNDLSGMMAQMCSTLDEAATSRTEIAFFTAVKATISKFTTVDWQVRESVRAKLWILVRRALKKGDYLQMAEEAAIDWC